MPDTHIPIPITRVTRTTQIPRHVAITMVMHAITVAMHLAQQAGLSAVVTVLEIAHEEAKDERERA